MNQKFFASFRIAFRALRVNKMRSALTMLGIIIGVAAVIAMLAIGTGAKQLIQQQISSIGSNLIMVWPGSQNQGGVRLGNGNSQSLTEDDAAAIAKDCPDVVAVSPVSNGRAQTVFGNLNWNTRVQGVSADYLNVRDLKVVEGNPFTQREVDSASKVALIGKTVVDNLFGGIDPVGQTMRLNNQPFTVMGVLESKGQSMGGQDQDDVVLIPFSTAQKRVTGRGQVHANSVGQIMVKASSSDHMDEAQDQVTALLRQRHRIPPGTEDDFQVHNMTELTSAFQGTATVMSLLLAGIASVSLVVGGIGIMNTMLISVTERTREIGLRQAVGAKTGDILTQFLVESVTLSVLGGIIGILIGMGSALAITVLFKWQTQVSTWSIVISFFFSAFVGIFFGFYPARKAAMLDPIDALRYE